MVKNSQALQETQSPGEGNGNPLKYSYLGNPMDRGAWRAMSMESHKNQTQLSD